jgi:hypothetical protein
MGKHKKESKDKKSKKESKHSKKSKKESKSKHSKKSSHKDRKPVDEGSNSRRVNSSSSSSINPNIRPITIDDYFIKNEHFRVWCVLIRKVSFESLNSDESHDLFKAIFLPAYNRNELPEMFYKDEIPVEMREAALKTKHK